LPQDGQHKAFDTPQIWEPAFISAGAERRQVEPTSAINFFDIASRVDVNVKKSSGSGLKESLLLSMSSTPDDVMILRKAESKSSCIRSISLRFRVMTLISVSEKTGRMEVEEMDGTTPSVGKRV